jgi:hypothetical protein
MSSDLIAWRRPPLRLSAGILLLLAACATPIQVERADPRALQRELDSNVISTGDISEPTQIVLHRQDLAAVKTADDRDYNSGIRECRSERLRRLSDSISVSLQGSSA